MSEVKTEFAALLEESRELKRKILLAFRQAEDKLPKRQRAEEDRQQAIASINNLQNALIQAKARIEE